jgi:hypothetical protein
MEDEESKKLCCLCGSRKANTLDHIFPECLFNKPRPTNLPPRIPACYECNNGLSSDEETFRVALASGMAYESDSGKRIWEKGIRPDLKGERPRLKQRIKLMVKQAKVVTELGNFVGYTYVLEADRESINRVLHKIAKGLYYLDTQRTLSNEVEILIGYGAENPKIFSPPLDEAIKSAKKIELGNGEVTYWRITAKDNPEESLTWIRFYEDKIFLVCTTRQKRVLA